MVEFRIKINPEQRLAYIPKEIVEAIGCELKATPNKAAVLLYPQNISVKDILKSLDIIRRDLKHGLELSKDKETQRR
jgi:hypothetical protein